MSGTLQRNAIELLAPARDADIGIAAIDHGADAVYIGGPAFGARQSAGNSLEDISRLCGYAHRYGAKVFLALNTIFTDEELPLARRLAFDAAAAGVDVLILQDLGLLEGPLPDIELHASTQCDIRTPEKAAFLERAGFSQVVAARELSLDEIRAMRAALKHARIECFVHGALCVSYSGRCFMSEAVVHRSANRGACSQLCRLPYDVETIDGRRLLENAHVLSLKDNDQSANLEALIDAGASTFKIEGRLKDLAYVKNATGRYRKLLDEIFARRPDLHASSDGRTRFSFEPDPARVFSRGQTEYFIHGRRFDEAYDLADLATPKSRGRAAARYIGRRRGRMALEPLAGVEIANGDGLVWTTSAGTLRGAAVNGVEQDRDGALIVQTSEPIPTAELPAAGQTLTRNRDHAFLKLMQGKTAERRIPITGVLTAVDDALDFMLSDGAVCGSAGVSIPIEAPSNPEKNRAQTTKNLSRLGDTEFELTELSLPEPFDVFIPASVANDLRRAAALDLRRAREAAREKPRRTPRSENLRAPFEVLGFEANVANQLARRFYENAGCRILAPAFEIQPVAGADLMTCRHCVRAQLKMCPKSARLYPQKDKALLRPDPLVLINSAGERFEARFHCREKPCFMTIVQKESRRDDE